MPRLDLTKARKLGYTDEQIQQFAASKGLNLYDSGVTQQATQPQKGFQPTDLLPIAGGIAGGVLGGVGGPVGAVAGGAAGSGLGEYARQQFAGENDPMKIASETGWGLAGGVGGELLGGGARLLGKLGPELGGAAPSLAAKNLASGFTVPAKLAQQLNLPEALDTVISHGKIPLSMGQAKKLAQTVTGETGLISTPIRTFSSKIKTPINYDEALTGAQSQLTMAGLDAKQIKTTMDQIRSHFPISRISKAGPGFVDAENAYDVIRQLEKRGYTMINKGSNDLNPNYFLEEQGKALIGVAQDMETQVSGALQAEGHFPKLQQQILSSLENNPNVGPGLYKAVSQARNVDELRAIQAPYVRLSRAADISTSRDMAPMTQAGNGLFNRATGGAAGFSVGGIPGAIAGAAAAPAVGGVMQASKMPLAAAGAATLNAVSKGAQQTGRLTTQSIGQSAAHGAEQMLQGGQAENANPLPSMEQQPTEQPTQQMGLDPQTTALLMAKYPKQAALIKSIYDVSAGDKKKETDSSVRNKNLAKSGLRNFNTMVTELEKDPSVTTKQLLPGRYLSRSFDSALFRTVEALLRIRTGQAAPETEVRRYMSQWGPRFGDSKKVINEKLQALQADLTDAYHYGDSGQQETSQPGLPVEGL
jgi:hypothetical protein